MGLRNIASGADGIPVELFQLLKHDVVNVCPQYVSTFGKLKLWPQDRKGQFSFQSDRRAMPKNV